MNQYANDFTSTVRTYYDELKRTKPLSRMKERRLIKLAKRGDLKARNELLESNLKFVFDVAKRYTGRGVSIGDLISEGNLGLMKAFEKFDEGKGVKFISYAVWWIRPSMLDAIQKRELMNSVEVEPGNGNDALFDKKFSDEDDEPYTNEPGFTVDNTIERMSEQNSLINKMFSNLSKRELKVITHSFGIDGKRKMNLIELGNELGITSERVRQIKTNAIRKMRSSAMMFDNVEDLIFN
jgi:RNA polymerase primary sigma factor